MDKLRVQVSDADRHEVTAVMRDAGLRVVEHPGHLTGHGHDRDIRAASAALGIAAWVDAGAQGV